MDIAAEIVLLAQYPRHLDELVHRVIGVLDDAGGEEQPLDIVAPVEIEREVDHLLRGEASARDVRALAVDAVVAIEDAVVGQQDLQERDAAPVRRIGVADAHALGRADPFAAERVFLRRAGGGAGGIILRRVGENFEALAERGLRQSVRHENLGKQLFCSLYVLMSHSLMQSLQAALR